MDWKTIAAELSTLHTAEAADREITGVEYDSRRVQPGSLFVAMQGGTTDGNRYIDAAIRQGAVAILTDSTEAYKTFQSTHADIAAALVAHGRYALAQASAAFFEHPEHKLHVIGVTGTNGKTTTSFLTEQLLQLAARRTILVGTIEYHVAGEIYTSPHTTPESRDLYALMAEGAQRGATELVMEVSSHALDQGRVLGLGFDVAVFTNLTRDHLDYHGTMEQYLAAKRQLFEGKRYTAPRVAVLNAHDEATAALAAATSAAGAQVITYGIGIGDWRAESVRFSPACVEFTLITPHGVADVRSPLAGEVNIFNLLAALAAAHARGIGFDTLTSFIPQLLPVPGRFQQVSAGQPFTVIVDYAHTDDALRNLTTLARQMTRGTGQGGGGRVLTLFGCGGDRDRTKRPKMGQAAGEGSDFVVATSDNPRSEDPAAILAEITPGLDATGTRYAVEPDRAAAIRILLDEAKPQDIVLIAGKGHEKEQVLNGRTIPFDDAEVALTALSALGYGQQDTKQL